jgi:hypothetical protein
MKHIESAIGERLQRLTEPQFKRVAEKWVDRTERRLAKACKIVMALPDGEPVDMMKMLVLQFFQVYCEEHSLAAWQTVIATILGWGWKAGLACKSGTEASRKLTMSLKGTITEQV